MAANEDDARAMAVAYADAWSSGVPERAASFFAMDGCTTVNNGEAIVGRAAIAKLADAFHSDFPGLTIRMDGFRCAGSHAVFLWSLQATHCATGNQVELSGWEEWDLNADLKIAKALGWYNKADLERQLAVPD